MKAVKSFFDLLIIIILIRCAPFKADFIDGSNNCPKEFAHQKRKKYEKKIRFFRTIF
jgi:hypothetical protein